MVIGQGRNVRQAEMLQKLSKHMFVWNSCWSYNKTYISGCLTQMCEIQETRRKCKIEAEPSAVGTVFWISCILHCCTWH